MIMPVAMIKVATLIGLVHLSDPLQPGLEDLYKQAVPWRTDIVWPDLRHRNGDAVVMKLHPRVSTVAFLLIVDASRRNHGFNHPSLAAQISRHAVMTDRRPVQNADLVAGVE